LIVDSLRIARAWAAVQSLISVAVVAIFSAFVVAPIAVSADS